jgi:hypothetical protein
MGFALLSVGMLAALVGLSLGAWWLCKRLVRAFVVRRLEREG